MDQIGEISALANQVDTPQESILGHAKSAGFSFERGKKCSFGTIIANMTISTDGRFPNCALDRKFDKNQLRALDTRFL